ncbi:MAG: 16S rRNA (adenine(1518)-N(6)/adenine(1519)-N(6))-dimethyltransferase RsmA [Acidobacteriaceae bacterium]
MSRAPQRPKLGQNFLISPTAQTAIADALGDLSQRTVVEIGPGRGAITAILARRAQRLIAIELDPALAAHLQADFADQPSVSILNQNILATGFEPLRSGPDERLLIVGNLPYYITSDILLHLFAAHQHIERAVLLIQREVADRVAAQPGSRDYGLLSVTAQLYARVEKLFTLPPGAFSPPPQVHSTVLRLTIAPRFDELALIASPDKPDPTAAFLQFVRMCFAQKRKTLSNNLRAAAYVPEAIAAALASASIAPQSRAEQLDLPAFAELFRHLENR